MRSQKAYKYQSKTRKLSGLNKSRYIFHEDEENKIEFIKIKKSLFFEKAPKIEKYNIFLEKLRSGIKTIIIS